MKKHAFTLIELLIVVAIIAILAAIAVPNFLEAQVRSKVARVKADLRSLATALEAYMTDYNDYPDYKHPDGNYAFIQYLPDLTTPVAYLTSVTIRDPFSPDRLTAAVQGGHMVPYDTTWIGSFHYVTYNGRWWANHPDYNPKGYVMNSWGPARIHCFMEHYPYLAIVNPNHQLPSQWNIPHYLDMLYDPTNGTRSRGGIGRQGGFPGIPETLGG